MSYILVFAWVPVWTITMQQYMTADGLDWDMVFCGECVSWSGPQVFATCELWCQCKVISMDMCSSTRFNYCMMFIVFLVFQFKRMVFLVIFMEMSIDLAFWIGGLIIERSPRRQRYGQSGMLQLLIRDICSVTSSNDKLVGRARWSGNNYMECSKTSDSKCLSPQILFYEYFGGWYVICVLPYIVLIGGHREGVTTDLSPEVRVITEWWFFPGLDGEGYCY